MNKGFVVPILLLLAPTTVFSQESEIPQTLKGEWKLVWNDEFDGSTLDLSKWRPEDAALKKNNEQQYYTPEDAYLENGNLVLRSQKRRMGSRPYTSGLVETIHLFKFKYGRVEVRAKLPGGQGIWPAHWLLPDDNSWPPEIDIMEMLGHDRTRVYMSNHYGFDWRSHRNTGESYRGPDFTQDFHIFAVEWTPEEIRWYVDGVQRFAVQKHIPKEDMRIILNTAVGGDWPGMPTKKTIFPQYHLIDYVRVYQIQ